MSAQEIPGPARKTIAVVQSNYIPWKGYFDLIAAADEFILYDDVQYTRRDWRNRNLIKTPHGLQWLTVPVKVKGRYYQSIRETEIVEGDWQSAHWKALSANYSRAPYFQSVARELKPIYLECNHRRLSDLNRTLIEWICAQLEIKTKISNSWDYELCDGTNERLAQLCRQAGATEYVSGPRAKDYIDESIFTGRGIAVRWFNYEGYPEYPQLWGEFKHHVTVLDLLFNCGKESARFLNRRPSTSSI